MWTIRLQGGKGNNTDKWTVIADVAAILVPGWGEESTKGKGKLFMVFSKNPRIFGEVGGFSLCG